MFARSSLLALRASTLKTTTVSFVPVARNAAFSTPRSVAVRGFASARDDFLKRLKEEIKYESQEVDDKGKQSRKHSSPFKVLSEDKSGSIVLGHETDGYKISVKFDAKELGYTYPEDDDPISTIPIQIEITPVGSDVAVLVTGEIEEQSASTEEGENGEEEIDETPYFTPETVQIGKPGDIPEDTFSPNLNELEEEFQDCFAEWLADFEVDHDLFQMVMDQAEKRENTIYLEWLKNLKTVVEKKN